jgi:hypothetical protein
MQASWGSENGAPKPARSGELYGEKGRWKVNGIESIPDVYTRADPGVRGADDAKKKFPQKEYTHEGPVQKQTTKKPAEMDLQANGLHLTGMMCPGKMTMADHDHGMIWPPPKGHANTPFMGMVKEPAIHANDVNGIMIGYKGHVPRARDKVGSNPLGGMIQGRSAEGFPPPEATSPDKLKGYGTQTSKAGEKDVFVSSSHAQQFTTAQIIAGQRSQSPTKLNTWGDKQGYIPRYSGHMPKAVDSIGGSVYGSKDGL